MCRIGDIILVYDAKNFGKKIGPHQFIVLDNAAGKIQGMSYDIISSVISSMTTKAKEAKYHKYPGNFSVLPEDRSIVRENYLPAFTKLDQSIFFFFDLSNVRYKSIGKVNPDVMELINEYIIELQNNGTKFYQITDNLVSPDTSSNLKEKDEIATEDEIEL